MEKTYVVMGYDNTYESTFIVGVYTNKDEAKASKKDAEEENNESALDGEIYIMEFTGTERHQMEE